MLYKNDTGFWGEELAAKFLEKKGYALLHRNWRFKKFEVDIIACKGEMLHFIEVKSRKSNKYGYPEENVSKAKIKNLINASVAFIEQNPQWKRIQFDVLAVTFTQPVDFFLIEDVFDF